jgi:transcriptional regulator with XRE-family HTH domain
MMLSKNLRIIRESRGIGVNELARRSGVNASYISAIENGRRENPSKEILNKIADALGIPVEELLVEKMRTEEYGTDNDVELRIMFNKIRNLSDGDKRKIKAVLDTFDQEVE